MSELSRRLNQCRKPTGEVGKFIASSMNKDHFEVTTWGLNKISIKQEDIILDIGCGGGRTINRLANIAKKGKVIGVDYSMDCVNWSKEFNKELIDEKRVEVYNANVEKLPFEDAKFNVVTAVETIYFWPDLLKSFREVKRVLKSNGTFTVINEMYISDKFKEKNDEYMDKMTMHTPEQLKQLFVDAGYEDVSIHVCEENNWMCCSGRA
ncbi:class I SAM-dependent methyltransferase [Clostridium coskatii]|uniref:Demethylrebeccamycin-D-glucose O-methyltransferase n=1 Tax=Clostridium coskatii TaxID=1705578 RepID=A0A162LBS7_9CLOT|nr:class I SAM-dependent methyltransferase [Clostridium coskatii]OAA93952.1 Demethylrebeccamycin-D-glucose O-methyltransferase [Clostridium coskatii]OBR95281.1 demethylrebeccamycin-D-glucose O-methyltransferase [Clostridium coskatii]